MSLEKETIDEIETLIDCLYQVRKAVDDPAAEIGWGLLVSLSHSTGRILVRASAIDTKRMAFNAVSTDSAHRPGKL